MNRSRVLTATVAVLLLVVVSLLGPSVSASTGPRVSLRPRAAAPTAQVQVQGLGYHPGERIELSLDATRMATFAAGQDGSFTHAIVIPPRTLPGDHEVTARGMRSGRVGSAPLAVRTNWAQGWFDAAHTAFNPLENVIAPGNVGRLAPVWQAPVPGGIWTSPVVANGRVYLGDGVGRMHAFDVADGTEVWAGPQQDTFYLSPAAVADGRVFASAVYRPLVAFDATTGAVLWTTEDTCTSVRASPAVVGSVVYLACFTGRLFALDAVTGEVLWRALGGCCVYDQAPVVDGGRVFQMRTNGTLTAYDAATGALEWSTPASSVGSLAAGGGNLFFGYPPNLVAVDQATGQVRWEAPVVCGAVRSTPALADGLVFYSNCTLAAVDVDSGDVEWTASAASTEGPSVANGVVYTSSLNGEWDAFDLEDGSLLWSVNIPGCGGTCANGIPLVTDGMLFLPGPDAYLRVYGLGP